MEPEVTVREIMTREYVGVSESDSVGAAADLMREEGTTGVVVLRGAEPVGMLTAGDALALVSTDAVATETPVSEVMSGTAPSVETDATVAEAAGVMADAGIGALLVRDGDDVSGIVSERDVVRATATLTDHAALANPQATRAQGAMATAGQAGEAANGGTDEEYSTQSVCEACGSLTADLRNVNGQLICGNCRGM